MSGDIIFPNLNRRDCRKGVGWGKQRERFPAFLNRRCFVEGGVKTFFAARDVVYNAVECGSPSEGLLRAELWVGLVFLVLFFCGQAPRLRGERTPAAGGRANGGHSNE